VCLTLEDGRAYSYGDVAAMSGRYAAALAKLGVRAGDRIAVQVEKSPEALLLYLATVRAGAMFLPLNTAYTPAELSYFLGDAEPALFVADPSKAEALKAICASTGVPHFETLGADGNGTLAELAAAQTGKWTDVARGPSDLAAILYTSGTTGRSKGAMLTHANLLSNAETLVTAWGFSGDDVLIHALPIFHTHGLFVATNVALRCGARMLFYPRFDAQKTIAAMAGATVLMGVPTFYTRMLAEPSLTVPAAAKMRLFISGSAPLLADTHREFREKTGHAILERYGMTETNMNTSNPLHGERVPGSVGPPLPGVEVRIADAESGRLLVTDEIGMIEVRGPNVFSGYWRMPEKTASEFRPDGFFITGDLGKIDANGYVWILGRGKDLIISGGFNVYPKEIELALDALPGVAESAVIGVPHPDYGEAVVAAVVPVKGASFDEATAISTLRDQLAGYKLPKRIVVVDELPRNTMAKVQKNVLRDANRHLFDKSAG
jgi:malonyl-CoA/methylmalonyl-CoA synthetase